MRDAINYRILISGLGSIGRRHLTNLESLGQTNLAFHRSGKSTIDSPLPGYPSFDDLDQALNEFNPEVVFVCGPSHTHLNVALKAVASGAHLFVEKPLAHTLDGLDELEHFAVKNNSTIMVGYMMRFHPLLNQIKEMIDSGRIGKLIHLRSQWGEYVPDWHPWEDYRETYAAKKTMGGGPAITLSHEIDTALWFLGTTKSVKAMTNTASELELDTEHGIDILISSQIGTTANLHLDFYQRPPKRTTEYVGSTGRIFFDYYAGIVEIFNSEQPEPVEVIKVPDSFERNNMFISELEHFFQCITTNGKPATALAEGKAALEIALQAIES